MAKKLKRLRQPIKIHGGKFYLADWIISHMPPRAKNPNKPAASDPGWLHMVHVYCGGLNPLWSMDPEGISEVANDIDAELTNFYAVIRDKNLFAKFVIQASLTPFSETEFDKALAATSSPLDRWGQNVEAAVAFFVKCRQSLAGRRKGFTGVTKTRTRRGMNNEVSAWLSAVAGLLEVHERLQRVLILNRSDLDVILNQDGPRTLFYLDPPYLHMTRITTGEYGHEMSNQDHANLLVTLGGDKVAQAISRALNKLPNIKPASWWLREKPIEGRFLLSGYNSLLYAVAAKAAGWRMVSKEIDNKSSGAKKKAKRLECLWMNYGTASATQGRKLVLRKRHNQ